MPQVRRLAAPSGRGRERARAAPAAPARANRGRPPPPRRAGRQPARTTLAPERADTAHPAAACAHKLDRPASMAKANACRGHLAPRPVALRTWPRISPRGVLRRAHVHIEQMLLAREQRSLARSALERRSSWRSSVRALQAPRAQLLGTRQAAGCQAAALSAPPVGIAELADVRWGVLCAEATNCYQRSRWTTSANSRRFGCVRGTSGRSAGYPSGISSAQKRPSGRPSSRRASCWSST